MASTGSPPPPRPRGRNAPGDRDLARFAPRLTITILAGFALFVAACALWVLPALLETPPPGAIPDYTRERVMAKLDGMVMPLFTGSMLIAALASIRGLIPGTGRR
ncbi:MAG: hypothetical protein JRG76_04755 [Deltaproteobacteria bacterium]|nr:hypothetical protein [Deltaproteobacteria bacterium]MBW2413802.1 hypothetical protein [Deltaproteobacteria bacterium]